MVTNQNITRTQALDPMRAESVCGSEELFLCVMRRTLAHPSLDASLCWRKKTKNLLMKTSEAATWCGGTLGSVKTQAPELPTPVGRQWPRKGSWPFWCGTQNQKALGLILAFLVTTLWCWAMVHFEWQLPCGQMTVPKDLMSYRRWRTHYTGSVTTAAPAFFETSAFCFWKRGNCTCFFCFTFQTVPLLANDVYGTALYKMWRTCKNTRSLQRQLGNELYSPACH